MMNYTLKHLIDKGVNVYIFDNLIYATNEEIYDELVKQVLERLARNDIFISPGNCVWREHKVEFLGYILIPQGMTMTKDKTNDI
jgi:uncharacterized protein YabN with tetrapyrrole methylase and pyrophosphatase domain